MKLYDLFGLIIFGLKFCRELELLSWLDLLIKNP